MKTLNLSAISLTLLVMLFMACSYAADSNNDDIGSYIVKSVTATNGLQMGIIFPTGTNTTDTELFLVFRFPPSRGAGVYQPKTNCLGTFTLYDTNNNPVLETAVGDSYRLKSDLQWDSRFMEKAHGQSIPTLADSNWTSRFVRLPAVQQLFKIRKPGAYRLVLESQFFFVGGGERDVVHFPPLEVSVVQPDDRRFQVSPRSSTSSNTSPPNANVPVQSQQ